MHYIINQLEIVIIFEIKESIINTNRNCKCNIHTPRKNRVEEPIPKHLFIYFSDLFEF